MKRKSDFARHQLPKNFPHNDSEFDYVRKEAKRNYTTFNPNLTGIYEGVPESLGRNQWRHSQTIVSQFVHDLINGMDHGIQQIQNKRMIASAICLTNSLAFQLVNFQDPQKCSNQIAPLPEIEPAKNLTDPISGFNKQNFIKKPNLKHKFEHDISMASLKDPSEANQSSIHHKKLPPLMKQLSQQKLQVFVPLDDGLTRKNSSFDFEEMVRERLLKEIENRKLKEKIDAISAGVQNQTSEIKKGGKSSHAAQNKNIPKEDLNFDYDGNKISIFNHGKVKSNLKILKTLYKMPKDRPEEAPSKLSKKFHEKFSHVPRGSRTYLEINTKTISDFGDLNYTTILKEKLEAELRKTEMKFIEKQFFGKEKDSKEFGVI